MPYPVDLIGIPASLLAGNRLRVDVGEAGFFEGRQFRISESLSIPVSTRKVYRVVIGTDTILTSSSLSLDQGGLKYSIVVGGTETGTFNQSVTAIPKNTMTTAGAYSSQNTLTTGADADVTGGTVIPEARVRTSTTGFIRFSGIAGINEVRGFGPQTLHLVLETLEDTNDTAFGIYQLEWEER